MTDPTDLIVQATFLGADDKVAIKGKARKHAPRVALRSVPAGPHCAVCRHWKGDDDGFGLCLRLVTVEERVPMGPAPGTVFAIEQAMQQGDWGWEYLRTRGFFAGCRQYEANADEAAA